MALFPLKRAAIIKAVSLATGLPVGKVIWSDQDIPRPLKPYINVNISLFSNHGREVTLPPDANGIGYQISQKEFHLLITAFSDGPTDTEAMLVGLSEYLITEQAKELFDSVDLVYVDTVMGPNCVSTKVDANFEVRSYIELRMRTPWVTQDNYQGNIEAVSLEGLVLDITGATLMSVDFLAGTEFIAPTFLLPGTTIKKKPDTLFQQFIATSFSVDYTFSYSALTTVTVNGVSALITDILVGDAASITYIEFHGAHNATTIAITR